MSILSDIVERVRSLVLHSRDERELDEELRTHMAMEAEYRRRTGASEASALRGSAMALGGIERVKDDVRDARGTRLLHDVWRDVGFAVRTLTNNPSFTLVTLATLAIGIGGTTAVFSAVDAVLLQPLPYAQPGQLVRLFQHRDDRPDERGIVTPVHFVEIRQRTAAFASTAALDLYSEHGADVGSGNMVRRIRTIPTTVDYFDVVHVHPEIGRGFTTDEELGCAAGFMAAVSAVSAYLPAHRATTTDPRSALQ
jgi:MacB-like periplasmic core domain